MHSLMRRAWVDVDLGALLRNGTTVATQTRVPLASDGQGGRVRTWARCASRARSSGSIRGASASRRSPRGRSCGRRRSRGPSSCSRRCSSDDFDAGASRGPRRRRSATPRRSCDGNEYGAPVASRDRHRHESRGYSVGSRLRSAATRCAPRRPRARSRTFIPPSETTTRASEQERRFDEALAALPSRPELIHAENSSGDRASRSVAVGPRAAREFFCTA